MTAEELVRISKSKDFMSLLGKINRWDLLPALFRVKGKPFSLEGREQFSVLFSPEIVRETIVMSGRQLGKSMSLSRSEGYDVASVDNLQILYVAPLQEQTRRYSDLYFSEAIRSCPLLQTLQKPAMLDILDSDSKIIKATGHQSFANGAGIQFTYAKDSGDRIRGVMADRIDFDEVQDQSADVIPIVQESLTSSEWGCSRYTGTAKVEENLIETKWRQSSMCEWVMKCEHCGTWAIPNLDGDVLKMIQADGIHCLHCGSRLNVLNGQWIAAFPDRMNTFRGYHIPQVICPFIVNNKNNWDKLLHKLLNGVLSTFIQENLGISYSVGQRLITMKHLQRQCLLPSARTLQEEIKRNPARYTYIVGGLDWGGAELSSFTVFTVIGIRPNGRIDVLWAERYRGFDPDEQMRAVAQACKFYGVKAVGADIGMGLDKNILLAKRFGIPIVQIQYTRQLKLFGRNQSKGRTNTVQCWTIDKVMALDVLFLAIRNRRIFFPKDEAFKSKFLPDILRAGRLLPRALLCVHGRHEDDGHGRGRHDPAGGVRRRPGGGRSP